MTTTREMRPGLDVSNLVGACPVCHLQYFGRLHNCGGPLPPPPDITGAQFLDEMEPAHEPPRTYSRRLAEGFSPLLWNVDGD